jgi:hypothetical protein
MALIFEDGASSSRGSRRLAQVLGFHVAFLILGSFALVGVALWVGFAATRRSGCAGVRDALRNAAE